MFLLFKTETSIFSNVAPILAGAIAKDGSAPIPGGILPSGSYFPAYLSRYPIDYGGPVWPI